MLKKISRASYAKVMPNVEFLSRILKCRQISSPNILSNVIAFNLTIRPGEKWEFYFYAQNCH